MQNGTTTLEESLAVSYKSKNTLAKGSSSCALWYLANGVENVCLHKNLHVDTESSFIHNCQNSNQRGCSSLREQINCGTPKWYTIIQC